MDIVAATNNDGKLAEMRRLFEGSGHRIISMAEAGVQVEVEENGETFAENAFIKAEAICKACGFATVADDSGLCVDALSGAPGVYSARYAGEHGNDDANNEKLLGALQGVALENRTAQFVSAVCFMLPDGRHLTCEGRCPGWVSPDYRPGDYGFGYDPIFVPDGVGMPDGTVRPNPEERSYSQLTPDEKDAISHRGRAMKKLQMMLPLFLNG